jgi:hypothetical protein
MSGGGAGLMSGGGASMMSGAPGGRGTSGFFGCSIIFNQCPRLNAQCTMQEGIRWDLGLVH